MTVDGDILVLCTGNVCRSPFLERRLRQELGATGIRVTSAGTGALVGHDMDPASKSLLVRAGADADGFTARALTADLVAGADLVLAAAREHRGTAARMQPAALRKAVTLRDLADLLAGISPEDVAGQSLTGSWVSRVVAAALARRGLVPARQDGVDLTDPIGRADEVFDQMAAEAEHALAVIAPVLRGPTSS